MTTLLVIATVSMTGPDTVWFKEVRVEGMWRGLMTQSSIPGYDLLVDLRKEEEVELEVKVVKPSDGSPSYLTVVRAVKIVSRAFEVTIQMSLLTDNQQAVRHFIRLLIDTRITREHDDIERHVIQAAERVGIPLDDGDVQRALKNIRRQNPVPMAA